MAVARPEILAQRKEWLSCKASALLLILENFSALRARWTCP